MIHLFPSDREGARGAIPAADPCRAPAALTSACTRPAGLGPLRRRLPFTSGGRAKGVPALPPNPPAQAAPLDGFEWALAPVGGGGHAEGHGCRSNGCSGGGVIPWGAARGPRRWLFPPNPRPYGGVAAAFGDDVVGAAAAGRRGLKGRPSPWRLSARCRREADRARGRQCTRPWQWL